MLFKEAKEILNNNGYKLVESKFRDPSDYASFYYPPEGPDTEEQEEEALDAASEEINSAVESISEGLKEKYPGVSVNAVGVSSNEDGELHDGRWEWSYTETFTCKLKLEIPLKHLNLTEEGAKTREENSEIVVEGNNEAYDTDNISKEDLYNKYE